MLTSKNLLTIQDLTTNEIEHILSTAQSFLEINRRPIKKLPTLRGRTIINVFLEPSTRTRTSFEIAGKRLGADVINFSASSSATVKGESLVDTAATLSAMSADAVVVRHKYSGAPHVVANRMDARVINGGDGLHQHPTQTLLDLFTMRQAIGELAGKTVGIVGDIVHSRVAGSLAPALAAVGAKPVFIAPPTFLPSNPEVLGAEVSYSLDEVLPELDVVYMLRIQGERADGLSVPSLREYATRWGMNLDRLNQAKSSAVVMHPGPMNRGVEMSADIADHPRTLVLDQVENGVAVRMAVLYLMLGGDVDVVAS